MPTNPGDERSNETSELEQIGKENKEAVGKLHSLVDELKIVEEHEKGILRGQINRCE